MIALCLLCMHAPVRHSAALCPSWAFLGEAPVLLSARPAFRAECCNAPLGEASCPGPSTPRVSRSVLSSPSRLPCSDCFFPYLHMCTHLRLPTLLQSHLCASRVPTQRPGSAYLIISFLFVDSVLPSFLSPLGHSSVPQFGKPRGLRCFS